MGFAPLKPHKGGLRPPLTLPKGSAEPEMPRLVFGLSANAFMYRGPHTDLSWSNQISKLGFSQTNHKSPTPPSLTVCARAKRSGAVGGIKGGKALCGDPKGQSPLEEKFAI